MLRRLSLNLVPLTRSGRCFHSSSFLSKKDYYQILGVPRNASAKDIKKAYFQLAKQHHPDANKGDPESSKKFHEVSEAYEVLSDESKRRTYDQFGTSSTQQGFGQGTSGYQEFHSQVDPEELFRKIFGDAFNAFGGARQGFNTDFDPETEYEKSDFRYSQAQEVVLNITFTEAARGAEKEIKITTLDTCPKCSGSRCAGGTRPTRCTYCNGTGMETISTGPFVMRSTCRMCKGTRMYISNPCPTCEGQGVTQQRKAVTVPIPAGVEDGQTLRMQIGNRELFITFRVAKSDYFRREGADVHSDITISLSQAILGGSTRIQGIYEDITIKIPPGTSSHSRLRLVGKGLKRINSYGNGDHYVHFKIKIPQSLNEKQRALVSAYAELEQDTPGSVDGLVETKTGRKKPVEKEEVSQDGSSSEESIFSRIKKAIFR
ncbi:dnaJ homolog l(2)tid, mitochondrial-like isoform X2 [Brevipalpus obovatus]|uniref:dnaJ homolog l(2)tid, mitochondrial-like isoform X2 n=1 Tax=Brevipalpus obovatus TaxID=246614 RepID=UPI003D9F3BA8